MWTTFGDLGQALASRGFWFSAVRFAVLASIGLAVAFVAFTALIVVLPLVLAAGLALHLYIRRKLRQAAAQRPPRPRDGAIEVEYTVIDRR